MPVGWHGLFCLALYEGVNHQGGDGHGKPCHCWCPPRVPLLRVECAYVIPIEPCSDMIARNGNSAPIFWQNSNRCDKGDDVNNAHPSQPSDI